MTSTPSLEVVRVRPGPTSTAWLVWRIRELQEGDPLRPVTVVVPGHHLGLHLRRRLAGEGYAGVRFSVLAQLAEALGAARLAAEGRAPLTAVTRAALVRRALRTAGEVLSGSADQAGLVDLVAALALELRRRGDLGADTPPDPRHRHGHRRGPPCTPSLNTSAAGWRRACTTRWTSSRPPPRRSRAAMQPGWSATLGAVLVHLPARLDAPDALLLRALARHTPVVVALPALDGGGEAEAAARLGVDLPISSVPSAMLPAAAVAVIAGDPIEEVRAAVRDVLAAMEGEHAVPLHRAAIVHARRGDVRDRPARHPAGGRDHPGGARRSATRRLRGGPRAARPDPAAGAGLRPPGRSRLAVRSPTPRRRAAQPGALGPALPGCRRGPRCGPVAGPPHRVRRVPCSAARPARGRPAALHEARRAAIQRDIDDAHQIAEQVAAIDMATRPPRSRPGRRT